MDLDGVVFVTTYSACKHYFGFVSQLLFKIGHYASTQRRTAVATYQTILLHSTYGDTICISLRY